MKLPFLAMLFFCICIRLSAQSTYSINGAVVDTASNAKLHNASISILNSKDSTLVKFTRANLSSTFSLSGLNPGRFILLITYPGYADYVDNIKLDSINRTRDLGNVNLILKSRILADVIIKGTIAAIKIKGDTTEFNAAAYKIQPNSKVEDLLKQLPGIQIDKDGKITAQGQTVTKVLVDGEEFFGDDPTLVTKNLRGDMVDKVQLFDKKSDQAAFTGIDDGATTKTINIKLKEDKKNGYFGKVDGGGATDTYYQAQGMFNRFKAKKKFSAYINTANTGKTGLSWSDSEKYGSAGTVQLMDGGGIMISGSGDDLESGGNYNGDGIPVANTGGMHFDSKWNGDKESININYKNGSVAVDGIYNSRNQNNLQTGPIINTSDQKFHNYTFRQKLDGTYQLKLDSSSNLKLNFDGTLKKTNSNKNYLSANIREDNTLQNKGDRTVSGKGNQEVFNASAFWTKKLKKAGRTLSLNLAGSINNSESDGYLNAVNTFYNTQEALDSTRFVDQFKPNVNKSNVLNTTATYTEPLSKTLSLVFNYTVSLTNSSADKKSFNQSRPGQYDLLDPIYSNNFDLEQLTNQTGATFSYKKNKHIATFGTRVARVNFNQTDLYTGNEYNRTFTNWGPQATYQYRFSAQKSLRFNYSGNTSQPGMEQIQPVRANTDPLNIVLGNPDLKPSYRSSFSSTFNTYKVLTSQYLYINGSYSITMNPIVNNRIYTSGGKSTSRYLNLSDKQPYNYYLNGSFSRKLKGLDVDAQMSLYINGGGNYNFVNNAINSTRYSNYRFDLSISKNVEKKYFFYVSFGPDFSKNTSSLQKQLDNSGGGSYANASGMIYLPGRVELSIDGRYQFKKPTPLNPEPFESFVMNTSLSKKFLKQDNLKLSFSGNDLFNQNNGINRSAFGSTTYTTIKRYFLFSLIWDFNHMGGEIKAPTK